MHGRQVVSSCLISFVSKQLFALADGCGSVPFTALFQTRLDNNCDSTATLVVLVIDKTLYVEIQFC